MTGLATDADATDTVTYSLTDDYNGAFEIDATTGVVTVKDGSKLDYETDTAPTIEITATSTDGTSSKATFTINLTDDTSESGISAVVDSDTDANVISESAVNGTEVQITGLATDADATDTVTYSLTDDYNGAFEIDATTGVVTVKDGSKLDYETDTAPTIEITATSTDGTSSKATFTI
ncbi:cadherin repeat domain-containing protein, partial [Vibrio toranzoniae]|uniref:cadherin repeat domain-containing protein n=1 Tax=Vibrio toranzoniae TaxID=1194427 RepID=UPI003075B939